MYSHVSLLVPMQNYCPPHVAQCGSRGERLKMANAPHAEFQRCSASVVIFDKSQVGKDGISTGFSVSFAIR